MNLWSDLSHLSGKTLTTLGVGKPFDVVEINEKSVVVKPHATGLERSIKPKEIQDAFEEICLQGSITLKGVRAFSEFSPVYIAALLAQLPCITFTNRPIHLKLFDPVKAVSHTPSDVRQ